MKLKTKQVKIMELGDGDIVLVYNTFSYLSMYLGQKDFGFVRRKRTWCGGLKIEIQTRYEKIIYKHEQIFDDIEKVFIIGD